MDFFDKKLFQLNRNSGISGSLKTVFFLNLFPVFPNLPFRQELRGPRNNYHTWYHCIFILFFIYTYLFLILKLTILWKSFVVQNISSCWNISFHILFWFPTWRVFIGCLMPKRSQQPRQAWRNNQTLFFMCCPEYKHGFIIYLSFIWSQTSSCFTITSKTDYFLKTARWHLRPTYLFCLELLLIFIFLESGAHMFAVKIVRFHLNGGYTWIMHVRCSPSMPKYAQTLNDYFNCFPAMCCEIQLSLRICSKSHWSPLCHSEISYGPWLIPVIFAFFFLKNPFFCCQTSWRPRRRSWRVRNPRRSCL